MKGYRLRELRVEKGLTFVSLGKEIGMSEGNVRLIEGEKRSGSIEALSKLADLYNVSLDYIECRTSYRNYDEIKYCILDELKSQVDENNKINIKIVEKIVTKVLNEK